MQALRLLATASVALAALVAAPTASAHAELVESRPAAAAVVEDAREVVLRFTEPVETALGTVRVFDSNDQRVDDGALTQRSSREVAVRLRDNLQQGLYIVSWQVVSADGHPVHGVFAFHLGVQGTWAFPLPSWLPRTPARP